MPQWELHGDSTALTYCKQMQVQQQGGGRQGGRSRTVHLGKVDVIVVCSFSVTDDSLLSGTPWISKDAESLGWHFGEMSWIRCIVFRLTSYELSSEFSSELSSDYGFFISFAGWRLALLSQHFRVVCDFVAYVNIRLLRAEFWQINWPGSILFALCWNIYFCRL